MHRFPIFLLSLTLAGGALAQEGLAPLTTELEDLSIPLITEQQDVLVPLTTDQQDVLVPSTTEQRNVVAPLTAGQIEAAQYEGVPLPDGRSALTVKVQILLDRAGISPGVIDGYKGGMSESAIRAYELREGLFVDGLLDEEVWIGLGGSMGQAITGTYEITVEDMEVSAELSRDYADLAQLEWIGYERVTERIAEQFHMDEDFLIALNPDAMFVHGETITITDPGPDLHAEVARIQIFERRLRAYDAQGNVVASYPVAVGSLATPSPSGTHTVDAIAIEPTYTYRPDVNFQQGNNTQAMILPPGPNGPVGLVWIDLSKPTYGIHGTPRPSKLFVEQSHGCVRMSNWDAQELAHMVGIGIEVEFVE